MYDGIHWNREGGGKYGKFSFGLRVGLTCSFEKLNFERNASFPSFHFPSLPVLKHFEWTVLTDVQFLLLRFPSFLFSLIFWFKNFEGNALALLLFFLVILFEFYFSVPSFFPFFCMEINDKQWNDWGTKFNFESFIFISTPFSYLKLYFIVTITFLTHTPVRSFLLRFYNFSSIDSQRRVGGEKAVLETIFLSFEIGEQRHIRYTFYTL